MKKEDFLRAVSEERKELMEYCKGRDFRVLLPAMVATIEIHAKQMPSLRSFIREQVNFLKKRV